MSKRKIEDIINDAFVFVEGEQKLEEKSNALNFIAHLRRKGVEIPDIQSSEEYLEEAIFKGEVVCFLQLESPGTGDTSLIIMNDQVPGTWVSWPEESQTNYESVPEAIKAAVWENLRFCCIEDCGKCAPGFTKYVLGKKADKLCKSSIMFDNPSEDALDAVKLMLDARISDIDKITA